MINWHSSIWGSGNIFRSIFAHNGNQYFNYTLKQLSITLTQFIASWQAIGIQEHRKRIQQPVIHFRYPKMHLVSHISESIRRECSLDNLACNISKLLHISTVREACGSSSKDNDIRQVLIHNNRYTRLDYLQKILLHYTLQGWNNTISAKVFHPLLTADIQRSNCRPYHLHHQHWQKESVFHHVSQKVHHLRDTPVCRVCRSLKLASLRDV